MAEAVLAPTLVAIDPAQRLDVKRQNLRPTDDGFRGRKSAAQLGFELVATESRSGVKLLAVAGHSLCLERRAIV